MQKSPAHTVRAIAFGLLLALTSGAGSETVARAGSARRAPASVASRVALIHFNPRLRSLDENVRNLTALVEEAFKGGADIVVAPELSSTGYSVTLEQVTNGLGLKRPFDGLSRIRALAAEHRGYVFIGVAEAERPGRAFNSVVVFGPGGLLTTGRKRGVAVWNSRGDSPFEVIRTPFGDLGTLVCSDTYLPDWTRVLALQGADVILSPANWWGGPGQEEIWQARARENGVWMVVANRWGGEVDDRFTPPYTYDMNDAPSDVISPDGTIRLSHRARQTGAPSDRILYYTIRVPSGRIGNATNPTYTVAQRRPAAYRGIGNPYYRPDAGNRPPPDLPPAGGTRVGAVVYRPSGDAAANLSNLRRLWEGLRGEVVVLPGLGVSRRPVESYVRGWAGASPWRELQEFADRNEILLLATTVREKFERGKPPRESVLVIQRGKPARLFGQVHGAGATRGTGQSPTLIDLPHARVAVLSGPDALFPELSTHLAKEGVDLVLVTSDLGGEGRGPAPRPPASVWDKTALLQAWKTSTNHGFHLAAVDSGGFGLLVQDGGGFTVHREALDLSRPAHVLGLDSAPPRRSKRLNAYYPFDLKVLLPAARGAAAG